MSRYCVAAVPYRYRDQKVLEFLLHKRDAHAPKYPNFFSTFGGGVDEGESLERAARRELEEEIKIIEILDKKVKKVESFNVGNLSCLYHENSETPIEFSTPHDTQVMFFFLAPNELQLQDVTTEIDNDGNELSNGTKTNLKDGSYIFITEGTAGSEWLSEEEMMGSDMIEKSIRQALLDVACHIQGSE